MYKSGDFLYFKGKYTRVLHAMCNVRGWFLHVNDGLPGSQSDVTALMQGDLPNLLYRIAYPNGVYAIGCDIYPLHPMLLQGYGHLTNDLKEEAFNSLLDCACVSIEHAFGRLKNRFR